MKIIVFGATGSVGSEILKQALQKDHQVTAFVRTPQKLAALRHYPNLAVFRGDVLNREDTVTAIEDKEAVLCALGDGKAGRIRAAGTKNILDAMHTTGVKRLICQTTLGMGESYGNLNFIWKHIMFGWLLKKAFIDHRQQEQYLLESNVDYTIVRPGALTDGALTRQYKEAFNSRFKKLSLKISRQDVAEFMLRQLGSDTYLKKAVSISN